MRVGRLIGALALVVAFIGFGATSALALPPPIPPWPEAVQWYRIDTDATGWSMRPEVLVSVPEKGQMSFQLSEPYWTSTGLAIQVRAQLETDGPHDDSDMVRLRVQGLCRSTQTGNITRVALYGMTQNPTYPGYGTRLLVSESDETCGTNGVPEGVEASFGIVKFGAGTTTWVQHMAWFADSAHEFEGPGIVWCRAIFGPDYTEETTAEWGGRTVTAGEMGCGEDYLSDPGLYTDFDKVCAGAPRAEWLSFSWLGPWVGHYSRCLFVPEGGWDRDGKIREALDAGWFGEVTELSGGLDGVDASAGCGTAVSDLPGPLGAISTCDVGGIWPTNMRNLAGVAVVGMSGVACVFLILRVLRIGRG